jgi:hypothetical protein
MNAAHCRTIAPARHTGETMNMQPVKGVLELADP